jgi:dienelactone hydrolase
MAEEFAREIADGKLEAATKRFDKKMSQMLPVAKLQDVLKAIDMQFGAVKSLGKSEVHHVGDADVVLIPATYERGALRYKISVTKAHQVSGFYIEPAPVQSAYVPPPYDKTAQYAEKEVQFGNEPWTIKGKLTMPKTRALCPIVVLVHGSGPHDEDETIGPNKMFRDLAVGLAGHGIATLRYQKRTYAHKDKLATVKSITLKEEVTDDALTALGFASAQKGIDRSRIFLVGHSLGATLAPIIAEQKKQIAGVVLMSGSARDPFDVVREQMDYIASLRGPEQDANKKMALEIHKAIKRAQSDREKTDEKILGAPVEYWRELQDATTKSLDVLPELKMRILVMGGGRDYQVNKKDFRLFKERLKENQRATFKWFDDVNHLFMAGKGKATPQEYEKANHVEEKVISSLAEWITSPASP